MSYKKPTLVEIYAEIYLKSSALPAPRFFDVVPDLKLAGFQQVEVLGGLEVNVADQNLKEQTRIRCWSEDRKRLAQISEDLVVVNLVGTYPGWNAFKDVLGSVHGAVRKSIGEFEIQSINLNSIDRFAAPLEGYTLDRYVNCNGSIVPTWYKGSKEPIDITLGRAILKEDGFNRQVRVHVRRSDKISIEFRVALHQFIKSTNDVDEVLEALHNESNEIFESLITDVTRSEIMEGVQV